MPTRHALSLSVQYPDPSLKTALPRAKLRRWAQAALLGPAELTLRLVDAQEGQALNRDYRGKDYATNVLTFAYGADGADGADGTDMADGVDGVDGVDGADGVDGVDGGDGVDGADGADGAGGAVQADIVLCGAVLEREAREQGKTLEAHAAHLVVHGVLHAQGYEHETDAEAEEMEALEARILARLGFPNPYLGTGQP